MSRFPQPSNTTTRRREPSFPALGGAATHATGPRSSAPATGAWGAPAPPSSTTPSSTTTASSESATTAARKSGGPSLSLGKGSFTAIGGTDSTDDAEGKVHPLKYTWDVWFSHRSSGAIAGKNGRKDPAAAEGGIKQGKEKESREEWEGGVVKLGGFSSIESLHPFLAHLTPPSALPASIASTARLFDPNDDSTSMPPTMNVISDLNIFRSPIAPAWEDPANTGGGRWVLRLRKGVADRVWEEVVYALVGERIGGDDERVDSKVNGVVLSVRKDEDILSLWCAPSSREQRDIIREALRTALEPLLTPTAAANLVLDYKPHPVAGHSNAPARNGIGHDGEAATASPNGASHRHRSDRDHHHARGDHHERRANGDGSHRHPRRDDGPGAGERRERTTAGAEGRERRGVGFSSYTNRGIGSEPRGDGESRGFGSSTLGGFGSRPRRGSVSKDGAPVSTNSRWS